MLADLHMHSYYSDGLLSPHEVARIAKEAGAEAVALTDHDTLDGIAEMDEACSRLALINVHGIELSTHLGCEVHVLGYGIDIADPDFDAFLQRLAEAKTRRVQAMVDLLNEYGLAITMEAVRGFAHSSLSRGHIARALVAAGYAPSFDVCFRKWLYEGGPCFVGNKGVSPLEAIERIHAAGGVAVLAHPMRMKIGDDKKTALVELLAEAGLDGIEASYKMMPPERTRLFYDLARRLGLWVTNGGDFHGGTSSVLPRPLDADTRTALGL